MATPDQHDPIDTPTAEDLRRAVLAELAAVAGRLGVDTDRGTWSALRHPGDDRGRDVTHAA